MTMVECRELHLFSVLFTSAQQDYSLCSTVAVMALVYETDVYMGHTYTHTHTCTISLTLSLSPPPPHTHIQESQVTIECIIEPKHHRSIMGPKGSNVQAITQDHDVSIKFPDREKPGTSSANVSSSTVPNGGAAAGAGEGASTGSNDGDAPAVNGDDDGGPGSEEPSAAPAVVDPRSIILITGRQENADAAKQALMVSDLI